MPASFSELTTKGAFTFSHNPSATPSFYLYSWGANDAGQLGLSESTTVKRSSPTQIGSQKWWTQISAGSQFALGLTTGGDLYAWGSNSLGRLGLSDLTYRSSPTLSGGGGIAWVSAGTTFGMAIKTNGTLWAWGQNANGQLGLGDTVNRSGVGHTQVGALTNWYRVQGTSGISFGIKTDGTMWSWGYGAGGQLGLGNLTSYSSPKQIGALTTWASVSIGGAIKTDGTLWTWGGNSTGELGLGNTTNYSSPKQVGALTTWASLSLNAGRSAAIKTDGTLWTWGYNYFGELGLGNTTNRSSPVQVGALTAWSKIDFGDSHAVSTKTDASMWAWGRNVYGILGLGDTTDRSSPVQVAANNGWSIASVGTDSYALSN